MPFQFYPRDVGIDTGVCGFLVESSICHRVFRLCVKKRIGGLREFSHAGSVFPLQEFASAALRSIESDGRQRISFSIA